MRGGGGEECVGSSSWGVKYCALKTGVVRFFNHILLILIEFG